MKQKRFFFLLHLARILKAHGDNPKERWLKLFWAKHGYLLGWVDK